ncbi:MAG TPA: HlyC/CorC family transporter [Clostridiales bacterium]|nr:HlyC/CorC family transporter [Clostridiales bacterium]
MESDSILPQLLLQLVLIAVNALFAATEIAVISLNETKVRRMAEGGDRKAAKMLRMVTEPTGFLSTIQICITLAGFLGSAFAADNFSDKLVNWLINDCEVSGVSPSALDTISVIIITLVLSYFTLVLGELVPKRIAMKRSESIARTVSGLMIGMTTVLRPIIWLLTVSTNGVLRLCGIDPEDNAEEVSEEEIIMMLDEGEEAGSIESGEKELIKNVFSLNDTTAEDVMVHRSQVAFLKRDDARTTLLNEIAESGYSRFPVYGENIDDIVGILYAKTYLTAQSRGERCEMKDFLMPPRFVHASTHINRILLDMQREHAHMAVVVDDYGGVIGIITLEDILEELVGEIWDESDEVIENIRERSDGSYDINGSTRLSDMCESIGCSIDSEADTVGGWVTEMLGGIPESGESFECGGMHVTVESTDKRRVLKVNVNVNILREDA